MLHLKFDQHFKNHHSGKLHKNYLVNKCFAQPSRIVLWNLRFYFCINVHKLGDSFTLIWRKKDLCHIVLFLYHILLSESSGLNFKLIRKKYGFSIDLKISLMNSGDKPILTLYVSLTNLFRYQYFADFDIKIVFLGQTSFEWIAFCWVFCILNLHGSFKIFCHCHLLLITSVLSNQFFLKP